MSANHPYHRLQLPPDVSFEVKPSPGRGWGAFATKPIKRGSLILWEKALFVIPKSTPEVMEVDVLTAFSQLSPKEKTQFLLLRDNGSKEFKSWFDVLAENCFSSADDSPAYGLYTLSSRFNHSCVPTARFPTTSEPFIELHATKDIEAGEEIRFCYDPDLKANTKYERHQFLGFVCDCRACLPGTSFQASSGLRRRLIRGLLYITRGVDLDGKVQISQSPLIVDPKVKAVAEARNIPLTSRMVLHLLTVVLLEEEGLLDDWAVKIIEPGVVKPVALFLSEYNHEIGELALTRDTWLKKLQVAFELYGRADPADKIITRMFQLMGQVCPERVMICHITTRLNSTMVGSSFPLQATAYPTPWSS
ncbi:hypothetical protein N7519_005162 [Penicillium mononematosum]|uniref:uncharacterized protein n=1 Tax=Penicillium mononematosum TaxID=268346 RepID=UPI002547C53F|nr:uncharacterized protein N7519_005162 [Penicillium mononematosum]KAJ6183861.1 hypothetical protein N7519_005162 [Penicillium mononematosum]